MIITCLPYYQVLKVLTDQINDRIFISKYFLLSTIFNTVSCPYLFQIHTVLVYQNISGVKHVQKMPSSRLVKAHLHYDCLPEQLQNGKGRVWLH